MSRLRCRRPGSTRSAARPGIVGGSQRVPVAMTNAAAVRLVGSAPAMAQTKHLFHEVGDLPLEAALKRGRDVNKRMKNFGPRLLELFR